MKEEQTEGLNQMFFSGILLIFRVYLIVIDYLFGWTWL